MNITKEQWQRIISILLSAAIAVAAVVGWDIGVRPLVFPNAGGVVVGSQALRERIGLDTPVDSWFFNGADIRMYSDNHSTEKIWLDGGVGDLTLARTLTVTNLISQSVGFNASGQIVASDGITISHGITSTDGVLNMTNNLITNIGNAGTDFTPPGGLTLVDGITATHAVLGGGYGSSGCTVLSTGVLECDGAADLAGGLNITGTVRVSSNTMNLGKIISGTVSNNGTIAHGLGAVPTYAVCSGWTSTSAPLTATVSISGAMNATNLRIGLGDSKNDAPWLGSIVVMCYVIP